MAKPDHKTTRWRFWPPPMTSIIIPSSAAMSPRKRPLVPVSSRRKAADDYFPFNFLPVECQLHVLSFLNEVDKCSCALVCLSWSCLVRSWKLWRVADYSRRGVFHLGQEGLLVSNREFERWKAWVHHYTHHLISRRASLLTLKASFDLGDRFNKWSELLSHLLNNVHCRDLSHLDLNWTFTLLEPLDLKVHSSSSSHQDSITKMDQVTWWWVQCESVFSEFRVNKVLVWSSLTGGGLCLWRLVI